VRRDWFSVNVIPHDYFWSNEIHSLVKAFAIVLSMLLRYDAVSLGSCFLTFCDHHIVWKQQEQITQWYIVIFQKKWYFSCTTLKN
jgi:hypothetical protein